MTTQHLAAAHIKKFLTDMDRYRWLWLVMTVTLGVIVTVVSVMRYPVWLGTQILVNRDQTVVGSFEKQVQDVTGRLARARARYINVVNESDQRTEDLQSARRYLAKASANQKTAQSVTLISRLDEPDLGDEQVAMEATPMISGSRFCGLVNGVGLAMLAEPQQESYDRRSGDRVGGRRQSNRDTNRQQSSYPDPASRSPTTTRQTFTSATYPDAAANIVAGSSCVPFVQPQSTNSSNSMSTTTSNPQLAS